MKKLTILFLSLSFFNGCIYSQNNKVKSDEITFISNYFKPSLYRADLMTGSKNNKRRTVLTLKMQAAIQDNFEWYVQFVKDAPNGYPIKYDKKLGLTEEEFKEFQQIMDNYRMASELTFDFAITITDSILEFDSKYEKELFDNLKVDLGKGKITLDNKEFKLRETVNKPDTLNRIGSAFKGYQWTYQIPDKIDFSNIAELIGKNVILYRIEFAVLQPSKTLYLSITGVEIEDGVYKISFVLPILLKTEEKQ